MHTTLANVPSDEFRNEALRKIGRNVVLFQQLEGVLKFLASMQHPSMPLSKAKATREERTDSIRTKTLGQVAGDVVQALYPDCHSELSAPNGIVEPWLSFSFRIDSDAASIEESRKTLKALIDERNDLVHHLMPRCNFQDAESCRALSEELDEQRSRIIREIERYRAYANSLKEMAKELQTFIDSDEGKKHFDLVYLQQSRLAAMMADIAREHARKDGWTLLSVAGNYLSQLMPSDFARLKTEHGEGSLQKLIVATELFDTCTEPTSGGGTRALYRLRANGDA